MTIDWTSEIWSYLLGVVHGDGSVGDRTVEISVGYKDREYLEVLAEMWQGLGYSPKIYTPRSAYKIALHSKELASEFRTWKQNGLWTLPEEINHAQWLAGVIDTDGCISLAKNKIAIIVSLKRSGNLNLVSMALARIGIPNVAVHNRSSSFKGKPYELEELRLTSFQNVMIFASRVTLLYPNKAKRLREQVEYIQTVQSHIPTWKQVALWLKEEPRTWEEVAERFNLTKKQFDSVMQNIKRVMEVEVIPPPKSLTRYRVKDPSSSQEP